MARAETGGPNAPDPGAAAGDMPAAAGDVPAAAGDTPAAAGDTPAAAGDRPADAPLILGPEARADQAAEAARDITAEALADTAAKPQAPAKANARSRRAHRRKARRHRTGLGGQLFLLALVCAVAALIYAYQGKRIALPIWAVAEVEARLNTSLEGALPAGALSLGAIEVMLGKDWVPHLVLEDVRLLKPGGATLLALPEAQLTLDPGGLLAGDFFARDIRIIGARLAVRRDREGHFDLSFGGGAGPQIDSLAALFDAADRVFARPALRHLERIEMEALSLRLTDLGAGKSWEVGDGRLIFENRPEDLAAELGFSLVEGGTAPSRAVLTVVSAKGAGTARISAQVDQVAAKDLASQTPLLGWLGILEAQVSGQIAATVDVTGVQALSGRLEIGAGAVKPSEATSAIAFDRASLGIGYDPAAGRIVLTGLDVDSPTLRLKASGQAYMVDAAGAAITGALAGRSPSAFLGQIAIDELKLDPEGLFDTPLTFAKGAIDLRLALDPFAVEIGQVSLSRGEERLVAKGSIRAGAEGWRTAMDVALNRVTLDGLLALWPKRLVPNTRAWVANNIRNAELRDVHAALRLEPGQAPRMELAYEFQGAELRYMLKMPPARHADGYATISGKTYTLVLTQGQVTPPEGGALDVSGTVFAVPDITVFPAQGDISFRARGPVTAMLSLLDQPPFHYLEKARQPVSLGQGTATVEARISLPLVQKVTPADVTYAVSATVEDFASDVIVPGHHVAARRLEATADPSGMTISGPGTIGAVPFDVRLRQDFGKDYTPARVTGEVTLSDEVVREFRLGLPKGMVSGEGMGAVEITLQRDEPGRLVLTSDLQGIGLALPDLAWRKAPGGKGRLEAEVVLGKRPEISALRVSGAGLEARGKVRLKPSGDLDLASFSKVTLGGWLDGAVEIRGRGAEPVGLAVTSGRIDLRQFPEDRGASGAAEGSPIEVTLDELRVTEGIALTGFRGDFSLAGGFNGTFAARINGDVAIEGTAVPSTHGTAVRIRSEDAGGAMRAAGMFASAYGGQLEMTLVPQETSGHYTGTADIGTMRVRQANVMADLLSSISIIGLLDQLNGDGIVFTSAQADFAIRPDAVELKRSSAIGASMGVSMEGVYDALTGGLDMSGVVSPVYLLNGIGAVLTRQGEGLFGFSYRLRGTSDAPEVSVNPLSILTPGMFRDIFRAAPSTASEGGG